MGKTTIKLAAHLEKLKVKIKKWKCDKSLQTMQKTSIKCWVY